MITRNLGLRSHVTSADDHKTGHWFFDQDDTLAADYDDLAVNHTMIGRYSLVTQSVILDKL